jgi:hypothetical protein
MKLYIAKHKTEEKQRVFLNDSVLAEFLQNNKDWAGEERETTQQFLIDGGYTRQVSEDMSLEEDVGTFVHMLKPEYVEFALDLYLKTSSKVLTISEVLEIQRMFGGKLGIPSNAAELGYWSNNHLEAFQETVGKVIGNYLDNQGNIFINGYEKLYATLFSTYLPLGNGLEDYDGFLEISLFKNGGIELSGNDGILVTTREEFEALTLALIDIDDVTIQTFPCWDKVENHRQVTWKSEICQEENQQLSTKIKLCIEKINEIAKVVKDFGTKYSERHKDETLK